MNNCSPSIKYIYFLLLIFVLGAAYFPVVRGYYLMEDDYWTYLDRNKTISANIGFKSQALDAARPLGALINYLSVKYARGISDLNYVRGVSLLILFICSCLLFSFMMKNGISTIVSFATSVTIFLSSSFQSNILKIFEINAVMAILIALYSSILSINFIKDDNGKSGYSAIAGIIFMQLIVLITYTHSITFYWFPVFIYISLISVNDFNNKLRKIVAAFLSPLFSMAIFALIYKAFFVKSQSQSLILGSSDLYTKLKWFLLSALPVGIDFPGILTDENLSRLRSTLTIGLGIENMILMIILSFSIIGFMYIITRDIRQLKSDSIKISYGHLATKYFILVSIVLLSIAPLFFSSTWSTCYRRFHAMQAVAIFTALFGLNSLVASLVRNRYEYVRKGVFISIIILMALSTHGIIKYKAGLLSAELIFIRKTIEENYTSKTKYIHIVQAHKIARLHDFAGFMTSLTPWVPGVVSAVIQDLNGPSFRQNSDEWSLGQSTNKVTASTLKELQDGSVVVNPITTMLINMSTVDYLIKSNSTLYNQEIARGSSGIRAHYNTKHSAPIVQNFSLCCNGGTWLSSGDYDGFPASNAFDDDFATTRWAGKDVGPSIYRRVFLGYDFGSANKRRVKTIVIRQASTLKSVLVQASNNENSWVDIDMIQMVADSNVRAYRLNNESSYSRWRLLANDKLPYPAAWAVYELKFLE